MKRIIVNIPEGTGPGQCRSGMGGEREENTGFRRILRNLPPLNWGNAGIIAHRRPRWSRRLHRQVARLSMRGRLSASRRPVVRTEVWRVVSG